MDFINFLSIYVQSWMPVWLYLRRWVLAGVTACLFAVLVQIVVESGVELG